MIRYIKTHKAFLSGLVIAQCLGHASPFYGDSFFGAFGDFFDDFHSTASLLTPAKTLEASERDLKERVKELQDESKKLSAAADKLAQELEKTEGEKSLDPAVDEITDSYLEVQKKVFAVRNESLIRAQAHISKNSPKEDEPNYTLKAAYDDENKAFVVRAMLPGITKDDIRISVKSAKKRGVDTRTLHVKAGHKKASIASKSGKASNSRVIQTSRYINGRCEELLLKDGILELFVDIPDDASSDLSTVQKSMRFENDELVLSFPVAQAQTAAETELHFDSEDGAETRKIKLKK